MRSWPRPASSTCACTASSRSSTAPFASTTASPRRVADAMPALAVTDLANAFGLVKFYRAARAHGVKPIFGCDVWLTHEAERDQPFRALLLAQSRAGYLRLAEWLTRAYRTNQHRGRAELRRDWLQRGHRRADRAFGRPRRRRRQLAPAGQRRAARRRPRARGPTSFRSATTSKCSARDAPTTTRSSPRPCGSPASSRCRSSPRIRCSSCGARIFARTRRASALPAVFVLADPRRPRHFTPDQYFKTQAEMAAAFADLPEALANSVAIAQRCNLTIPLGKNFLPDFPTPPAVTLDEPPAQRSRSRARAAARGAVSGCRGARREASRLRRAARLRDDDHRADGVRRLFPDRRRLHQLGEEQRRAGRTRDAAPAPARSSPMRSASPISIRCATACCSSASSIPSACRCRTSTSTSARTAATA